MGELVNIFDFDGVIGHPIEEALFTMPVHEHDKAFMEKMSRRHNLDLTYESHQSGRYICIQAAMQDLGIPIKRGPKADEVPVVGPYHILTARCDRFAVQRMHEFLDFEFGNLPLRTFHVGSTRKAHVLQMMLNLNDEVNYTFWDDNINHIHYANALDNPRMATKYVDNPMEVHYQDAVTLYETELLRHSL